jgi:hypothetical protein
VEKQMILQEGSFAEQSSPAFFYLALPLTNKSVASLKARRFEGCKGISSSPDIAKVNESYRILLKMKGHEVLGKNKLSRLLYSNADYLVSNDLAALRRIVLVDRPVDMIYLTFKDEISLLPGQDDFGMVFKAFSESKGKGKTINSVNDLFLFIRSVIPYLNLTSESESEWIDMSIEEYKKRILPRWLAKFSETYALEEEWILKDRTLTVPGHSTILVFDENLSIPRSRLASMTEYLRESGYEVRLQRRKP